MTSEPRVQLAMYSGGRSAWDHVVVTALGTAIGVAAQLEFLV